MPDMLVNLLRLPPHDASLDELRRAGVVVRRAQPWELTPVREFVACHFNEAWADEISVGFARQPVTVFVALRDGRLVGFAAYECTRKNFFGPTGVVEEERGLGLGRALLLASLRGLRESGYAYAIIGGVGPAEFYARAVGATLIPDSSPGIYADPLRTDADPE
ncbi:MAG: GNAT family N-acetyltransferase [Acidobacteria bacterium]|nr:MAG: GNAT family N-acetyltransferase [Acidobacteriota bacterium]PYS85201.1 MAG: GNAT family N-acetyltransferase [Acidobacteriota bacterium]